MSSPRKVPGGATNPPKGGKRVVKEQKRLLEEQLQEEDRYCKLDA